MKYWVFVTEIYASPLCKGKTLGKEYNGGNTKVKFLISYMHSVLSAKEPLFFLSKSSADGMEKGYLKSIRISWWVLVQYFLPTGAVLYMESLYDDMAGLPVLHWLLMEIDWLEKNFLLTLLIAKGLPIL